VPLVIHGRVLETTASIGGGSVELLGAAPGFETFAAGVGENNTTHYMITNNVEWESGLGTVTATSPEVYLQRDRVWSSSKPDGGRILWGPGLKDVYCALPAPVMAGRGLLLKMTTFLHETAALQYETTWTPDAAMRGCRVYCTGGGGGGESALAGTSSPDYNVTGGPGGGGGGTAIRWFDRDEIVGPVALKIGRYQAEGDGNDSEFGDPAILVGQGGRWVTRASILIADTHRSAAQPGGQGGTATGGDLNLPGGAGGPGIVTWPPSHTKIGGSGNGGCSFWSGSGARGNWASLDGRDADRESWGVGGGGGSGWPNAAARPGGEGAEGVIIVEEYA